MSMPGVQRVSVPVGPDFPERIARAIVDSFNDQLPDLSLSTVVVPHYWAAAELRTALGVAAGRTLLLPRLVTLSDLAASYLPENRQPDSLRQIILYERLRTMRVLSEAALWELSAELIALFDELTERAVLPSVSYNDFVTRLEAAYRAHASAPMRFEAKLVHDCWRAEAEGPPGKAAAQAMSLAMLALQPPGPCWVLADVPLAPSVLSVLETWANTQPVTLFESFRWERVHSSVAQFLEVTWPIQAGDSRGMVERVADLALNQDPFAGRFRLMRCESLEDEAVAVTRCVGEWLASGKRKIALIAQDRAAARRTRALLERDGVLVADEVGWKLSTTRAAAAIDAWLEVLTGDAYHRDLLDLVKSPFIFSEMTPEQRSEAAGQLNQHLAEQDLVSGLERIHASLARHAEAPAAKDMMSRLVLASKDIPLRSTSISRWVDRLMESLKVLGAWDALAADAAGSEMLNLLRARRAELAEVSYPLDFAAWRDWLNRELENATFIEHDIESPVVMTHLAGLSLRRFDAVALLGADAEHLCVEQRKAVFGSAAVRAELGLETPQEARDRLRDQLRWLLVVSGEVLATWQHIRRGELVLLASDLELLRLAYRAKFDKELVSAAPPRHEWQTGHGTKMPCPSVPQRQLPVSVTASAYARLVSCPYRFFAAHVLRLGETDAVLEEMEKRQYGEIVHTVLQRFHEQYPIIGTVSDEVLSEALEGLATKLFAESVENNFLHHAWRYRFVRRIPSYLVWQRAREADAWFFHSGEAAFNHMLDIPGGEPLKLTGRVDRLDRSKEALAVLDYKTNRRDALVRRVSDADSDVQLAFYGLLLNGAAHEAAYVALDDDAVQDVALKDFDEAVAAQGERLLSTFRMMREGAALPANGAPKTCAWCEMRGVCRRDYHHE